MATALCGYLHRFFVFPMSTLKTQQKSR